MADSYVSKTGLSYFYNRLKTVFASKTAFDELSDEVEQIIAEGGEPNVIETVKVNGTALVPVNKAVDVDLSDYALSEDVPTAVSELDNDANYATTDYVDEKAGDSNIIETVKVNGTALTPDANKAVNVEAAEVSGGRGRISFSQGDYTVTFGEDNKGMAVTGSMYDDPIVLASADYVDTHAGKIDSISIDGVTQTIDANKNVALDLSDYAKDEDIPTATSDLTNDSDFQTGTEVQTAIDNALADITSIDFEVVQTLPATGEKGIIYLLANSGAGSNIYDEYIWIDGDPTGRFEKIGTTEVDLSNYWTSVSGQSNSLIAVTTAEIDEIMDGTQVGG